MVCGLDGRTCLSRSHTPFFCLINLSSVVALLPTRRYYLSINHHALATVRRNGRFICA